jgi:hypothetical protein
VGTVINLVVPRMPLPAARQRPAYFSALPPCEVADLERAGPDSPAAVLYGQTIYLPGHRELAAAVGRVAFVRCCTRFPRLPCSYVLMAPGSPLASHAQWGRIPAPDNRDHDRCRHR